MTKQLTPLRRKDQATGYQAAVKDIVAWLREEQAATEQLRDEMDSKTEGWRYADEHASAIEQSANAIEDKFGKANGPNNVASIQGESSALDSLK